MDRSVRAMRASDFEIAGLAHGEEGVALVVLIRRQQMSGYAAPALALSVGPKLELWVDTEQAPLCESMSVAAERSAAEWGRLFQEKGSPRSEVLNLRTEWKTRGWTAAIVHRVQREHPHPIVCMVGHFAGTNRKVFEEVLSDCRTRHLPESVSLATALSRTPFFQSRAQLGYSVAELAMACLPKEIWVRLYLSKLTPGEVESARSLPKVHGDRSRFDFGWKWLPMDDLGRE